MLIIGFGNQVSVMKASSERILTSAFESRHQVNVHPTLGGYSSTVLILAVGFSTLITIPMSYG
jgi:hypothetical protein